MERVYIYYNFASLSNQLKINIMCKTSKLATSFQTMQKYGVVFVSKTSAVDFLTFCKMAETKVSYSLSGNKIKFDLLDK